MSSFPDYYTMLGVAVDAPPAAIKTAFKKLALQYHPDVYKGDDAQERMRVLLQAYQTLNDPEERRKYDARRSEHIHDGHVYRQSPSSSRSGLSARGGARVTVTPGARRDRQRHYDFPDFYEGRSVYIDLVDFAYTLSPIDAHTLLQQGLLRGVAPGNEDYHCHRCSHHWNSVAADKKNLPAFCPNCKATDWSEYLLLRCIHCSAVFESEQIRYEVGSINYGKGHQMGETELCPPYELFPLCPYCGTARWCPAEETRVSTLRELAVRRATILRGMWISVVIVLVLVVGVVALVLH
jgi:DNA-directed RNA polymerase subunit RPC12/RpoP